jgi:dienelactone hydrolase
MTYDPFARGPFPVGVLSLHYRDPESSRQLEFELWYPAAERHRGEDLAGESRDRVVIAPGVPATTQDAVRDAETMPGVYPLFIYCHGGYGDRRESTHLTTHLASHGYLVAAPRFAGDSYLDTLPGPNGEEPVISKTPIDESARRRPRQASAFIDWLVAALLPGGLGIEADRIGVGGFSMGGYTALALNSIDPRPRAVFCMCPMFGERSALPQVRRLQSLLRVDDWGRRVPALVLSGQLDPMVNAEDMRLLFDNLAVPKQLVLLAKAGHLHWADGAAEMHEMYRRNYLGGAFPDPEIDVLALGRAMRPFAELCTEKQAGDAARSLALAHLDAWLRAMGDARDFLDTGVVPAFASRGMDAQIQRDNQD